MLVGAGLAVAARSVRLEGIAFVGGPPIAVDATVADGVWLDDIIVLGHPPDERSGSTVQLVAAGGGGAQAELRDVVLGHSGAADALIGAFRHEGTWWQTLTLERVAASATAGDAVLAMDSVASLRLRDCALAVGQARTLLRMLVAPTEGEIAASRLSAGAADLASVIHPDPARPAPLRLVDGAATTVPAGELPPGFEGEAERGRRRDGRRGDRRGRRPCPRARGRRGRPARAAAPVGSARVLRTAVIVPAEAAEEVIDALVPLLPRGVHERDAGEGTVELAFYEHAAALPPREELEAAAGGHALRWEREEVPDDPRRAPPPLRPGVGGRRAACASARPPTRRATARCPSS